MPPKNPNEKFEWPPENLPPPQLESKVFNDIELAQFILTQCAELGFPLDQLLHEDENHDSYHYLELFLDFCHNTVHGLQRPGIHWGGSRRYLLPEHVQFSAHSDNSESWQP